MMLATWVAATVCVLVVYYLWLLLPYRKRRSLHKQLEKGTIPLKKPSETVNTLIVLGSGASALDEL